MQLWDEYGIISYNMGNNNQYLMESYYSMLLALRETKPKLIVIDAFETIEASKIRIGFEDQVHDSFDVYPISYTKYLAIKDLFEEDFMKKEVEYLFNFSKYHSRWKELKKEDFILDKNYEKGAEGKIDVVPMEKTCEYEDVEYIPLVDSINVIYLRKMIEYCKENNLPILVINIPYAATENRIICSKHIKKVCEEYNVEYLDFLALDVIDTKSDLADEFWHLNPSGERKVTSYLGKHIIDNYGIPNHKNDEEYKFWNDDYNEYIDFKINNLKLNENNLNNYIMLLYGEKDINYKIEISSRLDIQNEEVLKKLLENINNNYTINDEVFKDKQEKTIKITTYDSRNSKEIGVVWF